MSMFGSNGTGSFCMQTLEYTSSWRTHSCVQRRDSSRRPGLDMSVEAARKSACATDLEQVSRRGAAFPLAPRLVLYRQADVNFFQRSEESHERAAQVGRRTPATPEIAMPE